MIPSLLVLMCQQWDFSTSSARRHHAVVVFRDQLTRKQRAQTNRICWMCLYAFSYLSWSWTLVKACENHIVCYAAIKPSSFVKLIFLCAWCRRKPGRCTASHYWQPYFVDYLFYFQLKVHIGLFSRALNLINIQVYMHQEYHIALVDNSFNFFQNPTIIKDRF